MEDKVISKELLSEVLEVKAKRENHLTNEFLYFKVEIGESGRLVDANINIHQLAHKCKQWALSKGYYFSVYSFNFSLNSEQEHRVRLLEDGIVVYHGEDSCKEAEHEAIFKACQWIKDNK